jgi:predicted phosphodiesterase
VRYLVLSDIHGNLEALNAVLEDAKGLYDQILNCGDLVGYGPNPNEVVEWSRSSSNATVRGNHDKVCVGLDDLGWFNALAQRSAVWTHDELTPENVEYLKGLPKGPVGVDSFEILHGSPRDEDEYLIEKGEVQDAAAYLERNLAFFGHTHIQGGFLIHRNGTMPIRHTVVELENDTRYMINPGSVGQPRDGDGRAAWCLYAPDERVVEFRRTVYDLETTQQKIREAGLPELLAYRLGIGT